MYDFAGKAQNSGRRGRQAMSTGLLPFPEAAQPGGGPQPDWQRQLGEWRGLIAACEQKPGRKRVHALRVSTLRLQAELEYWVPAGKAGNPTTRAVQRWSRQAKKLRRMLGPVRAADVSAQKLERLGETVAKGGPDAQCGDKCRRQLKRVEERYSEQRRRAAKRLLTELEARRARLNRCSMELESALAEHPASRSAEVVRREIVGLVTEFAELNGETLHLFRKRIKTARYLADVCAAADPVACRDAAILGRMQVAVGEWHDWDVLAARLSGSKGKRDGELPELLETLAARSLKKALKVCGRMTERLVRHGMTEETAEPPAIPKKPVRRAEPVAAQRDRQRA